MIKSFRICSILIIISFFQFINTSQPKHFPPLNTRTDHSSAQLKQKELPEAAEKQLELDRCKEIVKQYNQNLKPGTTAHLALSFNEDGWPIIKLITRLNMQLTRNEEVPTPSSPTKKIQPKVSTQQLKKIFSVKTKL